MLGRDALQGFLRLGFFVGGCGLVMVPFQPPGSAEQILSICSAAMGGVLILGVVVVTRVLRADGDEREGNGRL